MVIDVPTLLTLNDTQLNDTFRSGVADPIPDGPAKGTAIIAPGTGFHRRLPRRQPVRLAGQDLRRARTAC